MTRLIAPLLALALLPATVHADEITDALDAATAAYKNGEIQYALEELDFARNKMLALKTDALTEYLPEAPAGWTRTVNTEMNAGMAMMGGGVGAEARYNSDDAEFTITMMADNPMVASMGAMLANAGMMGLKLERIGRQKFMVQEGEYTGLVDNRVLIQARGDQPDLILDTLKTIDFAALGKFGN